MTELENAVRRWAQGVYPVEAGAELLIRQGKAIYEGAPWLREVGAEVGQRMVEIDHVKLSSWSRAWSGSERRIVDVATSLLYRRGRVNLHDAVTGLDPEQLELVLAAISHAAGSHETPSKIRGYSGPVNAHPWPERLNSIGSTSRPNRAVVHEQGDASGGPSRTL